jgi:hypothetical protein
MFAATTFLLMANAFAAQAGAQDRTPAIPADKMTEAQRKAVAESGEARGAGYLRLFVPRPAEP